MLPDRAPRLAAAARAHAECSSRSRRLGAALSLLRGVCAASTVFSSSSRAQLGDCSRPGSSVLHYPPEFITAPSKTNAEGTVQFSPFFIKVKTVFGFLLVSENKYWCRSFLKAKRHKPNFQKVRDTCVRSVRSGHPRRSPLALRTSIGPCVTCTLLTGPTFPLNHRASS